MLRKHDAALSTRSSLQTATKEQQWQTYRSRCVNFVLAIDKADPHALHASLPKVTVSAFASGFRVSSISDMTHKRRS